jgi:glycerate 2-kinase
MSVKVNEKHRMIEMGKLPSQCNCLIDAALRSVNPGRLLRRYVKFKGNVLSVGRLRYDLKKARAIYVVGAGKASALMASALEEILGERITGGLVITRYGYGMATRWIRIHEAGHPIPDRAGLNAGQRLLRLIMKTAPKDLIIALWSGGASALLPAPVRGVSLEEKKRVTRLLLNSGATIEEVNAVRKHLSRIKGGQLGRTLAPRRVISLILSDVKDNRLDVIASGPTVPDPTIYGEAIGVLKRYGLWDGSPKGIRTHLERGALGEIPETPKPGQPSLSHVQNLIIGDNHLAVQAVAREAKRRGFHVWIWPGFIEGEAREIAGRFVTLARKIHQTGRPVLKPACIIAGGETTVTVRGSGKGGRCQEFALAAAERIAGLARTVIMAFGTDGMDGTPPQRTGSGCPPPVAGAFVDDTTRARAKAFGLDPQAFLAQNDSYSFFKTLGDQIITGPTHTNVNDLYLMMVF